MRVYYSECLFVAVIFLSFSQSYVIFTFNASETSMKYFHCILPIHIEMYDRPVQIDSGTRNIYKVFALLDDTIYIFSWTDLFYFTVPY